MRLTISIKVLLLAAILFAAITSHAQIITTVAGSGVYGYTIDTPALECSMSPLAMAVDDSGNIYISQLVGQQLCKISAATGIITPIAGNGTAGYSGDGGPALSAQINNPSDLIVDKHGNVFFQDNDVYIRVVSPDGIIRTYAGNGTLGFSGDGGPATAAALYTPVGFAIDTADNLYFINDYNTIRKIDATTGTIHTIAGDNTSGNSGDGGDASLALFAEANSLAFDTTGNMYIADPYNDVIRKINGSTNIITTIAGNPADTPVTSPEDGLPALDVNLIDPVFLATDHYGNIFVCSTDDSRVRRIDHVTGIITTAAGNDTAGFSGDGGPAALAKLYSPSSIAFDGHNNLYILDYMNRRIRKVTDTSFTTTVHNVTNNTTCTLSPNPTTSATYLHLSNEGDYTITLINMTGQTIATQHAQGTDFNIDMSMQASGAYILQVVGSDGVFTKQLVKD